MASVRQLKKTHVGAGSYMYEFHAHYIWGGGGVFVVGPWANDNEAREEAQGLADAYESENSPLPLPPKKKPKNE
jgi:hypothetical protein